MKDGRGKIGDGCMLVVQVLSTPLTRVSTHPTPGYTDLKIGAKLSQ